MSTDVSAEGATKGPVVKPGEMWLEVVTLPVADVDRAKEFYEGLGWRLDIDFEPGPGLRVVQFTPPGSPCSIQFGSGSPSPDPGSAQGIFLVVSDIEGAGDHDVFRKVRNDFDAAGVNQSDHQIRRTMDELMAQAIEQIKNS